MHPADWPTITAPRAWPGSTQTVLTAPAAKVLLSTRDRHLHARWPGRGRGLREGGKGRKPGNPRTDNGGVVARAPRRTRRQEAAEGVSSQDPARGGGLLEVAGFVVGGEKCRGLP